MDRFTFLLISAPIWKPMAKYIATGLIGAAVAYAVDRQFFDATLANTLANDLLAVVDQLLK